MRRPQNTTNHSTKPMRCVSPRIHTILQNQLGVWAQNTFHTASLMGMWALEHFHSNKISVVCGHHNKMPSYHISVMCGPQNTYHTTKSAGSVGPRTQSIQPTQCTAILPNQCVVSLVWAPETYRITKSMWCVGPRTTTNQTIQQNQCDVWAPEYIPSYKNQLGVWAPEHIPSGQLSVVCEPKNTYHPTKTAWYTGPRTHSIRPAQWGVWAPEHIPSGQLNVVYEPKNTYGSNGTVTSYQFIVGVLARNSVAKFIVPYRGIKSTMA